MSVLQAQRHVLFAASPKPLLLPPMACTTTSSLRRSNSEATMRLRQTSSWPSCHQSSPSSLSRRRRAQRASSTVCHGFFGSLLGGGKT
eukprot:1144490-Pelagomonas_calceolata.AAC.8